MSDAITEDWFGFADGKRIVQGKTGPDQHDNAGDVVWAIWIGDARHPDAVTHIPHCPKSEAQAYARDWAAEQR
jgi:hypothetical protein